MIKLSTSEAKAYEMVKRGAKINEMVHGIGLSRDTVQKILWKLKNKGCIEYDTSRKATIRLVNKYHALPIQYEVKPERPRRRRLPNTKFSLLKHLIKEYGADNIRYILLRQNDCSLGYLEKKTGIPKKRLETILDKLFKYVGVSYGYEVQT